MFIEDARPISLVTVTENVIFVSTISRGAINDGEAVSAPDNGTISGPCSDHKYLKLLTSSLETWTLRTTMSP